ncbi:hypothetical protein BB561_004651 [Smittium simulii]|uniref:Deacetylase sirtuin-type domain-containing protein n=1 Tax=Smittium simulii TaxID=133385 RepID=A0A2T9YF05_9FUNG|nr:hypothetical protein BB561_004651 [Smittium simulii]
MSALNSKKTKKIKLCDLKQDTQYKELSGNSQDLETWWRITKAILNSKRCIIITGAGISVSSGIPDFRSPEGLFESLKKSHPKDLATGKDLFDANLFKSQKLVKLFYTFMGQLKKLVKKAKSTHTHNFIKKLDEQGKLLRCYTQNIDNLEELAGLTTSFLEVEKNPRKRKTELELESKQLSDKSLLTNNSCFVDISFGNNKNEIINHSSANIDPKNMQSTKTDNSDIIMIINTNNNISKCFSNHFKPDVDANKDLSLESADKKSNSETQLSNKKRKLKRSLLEIDKNFTKAVQLHGSLENVSCTFCYTKYTFSEDLMEKFSNGEIVPCESCKSNDKKRLDFGKRALGVGILRPDIVLYNELHPHAETIGKFTQHDLRRKPDLLIVMGTSLKIPGVKRLVKEISKVVSASAHGVHKSGSAKSIFINRGPPSGFAGWENIFDYFVDGTSDEAVELLNYKINVDSLPLSSFINDNVISSSKEKTSSSAKLKVNIEDTTLEAKKIGKTNKKSENAEDFFVDILLEKTQPFTSKCMPFIESKTKLKKSFCMVKNKSQEPTRNAGACKKLKAKSLSLNNKDEIFDNIYYKLFSDPSTLTDICSSDIEKFSDVSFDVENDKDSQNDAAQDGNLTDVNVTAQDGDLTDVNVTAQDGDLTDVNVTAQDGDLTDVNVTAQDGDLTDVNVTAQDGDLTDVNVTAQDGDLTDVNVTAQDGDLTDVNVTAQDGDLTDVNVTAQGGDLTDENVTAQDGNLKDENVQTTMFCSEGYNSNVEEFNTEEIQNKVLDTSEEASKRTSLSSTTSSILTLIGEDVLPLDDLNSNINYLKDCISVIETDFF